MNYTGNGTSGVNPNLNHCGWPKRPPVPMKHPMMFLDLGTYPVFLACCTVGNLISLIVLTRDRGFGPKNIYLIGIAVADLLYMWTALLSYLSNYDGVIYGYVRPQTRAFLEPIQGFGWFMQETAALASAWLIVAFTVERFLAIKYPLKHMMISKGKRTIVIVAAVFALAAVTAMARSIDYYWYYANHLSIPLHERPKQPPNRPKPLLDLNSGYLIIQKTAQFSTFITILVLNIYLIHVIIQSNRRRREQLVASTDSRDGGSGVDWSALSMLGACVVLYLVTQSGNFVTNIIDLFDRFCIAESDKSIRPVLAPIMNTLFNLNFTANFFIYCGVNSKFRKSVKELCGLTRLRRGTLTNTTTVTSTKKTSVSGMDCIHANPFHHHHNHHSDQTHEMHRIGNKAEGHKL